MSDLIITGIQWIMLLGQGFLFQSFFGSFLEYRSKHNKWKVPLITALYGSLAYGVDCILPEEYGIVRIFGKKIFTLVLILIMTFCFYEAKRMITTFLVVTFMAVSDICFFLAYMIMQMGTYLNAFWLELFEQGYFNTDAEFMIAVEVSMTMLLFIMYGVFLLLTGFALRRVVISFREKDYLLEKKEMPFLMAPGMVGFLLCLLLRLIMITVEEGSPKLLYDRHPPLILLVPVIMVLALFSIIYSVKLFQDMIALHRESSSRVILEKQIVGMQEHVSEVERIYSGVRSMKHDMRNTLGVIMQLAGKDSENAELQAYLAEVNQSFDRLESQFKTGNVVADTLLNMKYHEMVCIIPDIRISCDDLLFPDELNIQSYDIGVIIGNALDNAMEACRKTKLEKPDMQTFIRLSSFVKGKMLFIEVMNSFSGKVVRKDNSEFPITDKADKNAHGVGLLNIRNTAEKYHGAVDWAVSGNVFTLTVMLKNERRENNEYQ